MEEIPTRYRDGFCQVCGEIAHTLDFEGALRSVLDSVHSCVDVDASAILLLDPSHRTLSVAASRNLSEAYTNADPIEVEKDPLSAEALKDRVFAIEDMQENPSYSDLAGQEGLRSALVIPLKSRGRPVGALWVYTRGHRKFTSEETSYLKTLGAQAGMALSNARLHQSLHILSDVGRAVTSRVDEAGILRLVVKNGTELFHGKGASIFLLDPRKNTLELKASHGMGEGFFEKNSLPVNDSVRECLERLVVISNISTDRTSDFPEKTEEEGIHAIVCAPLRVREKAIGVLRLYMDHIRKFSREERMFFNILADFSAIAIENARLVKHIRRDYEDLTRDVWHWYDWGERPPRI